MKHLLNGAAIAVALVLATPVWAQSAGGGNAPLGGLRPGPAGGPGLTPYGGAAAVAPNPAPPSSTSATVPVHHAVRHAHAMHAFHRHMAAKAALTGDTTAQLNREELARIQSGNLGNAPAPSGPAPMGAPENASGGNAVGTPGPNPGGPGLTPYSGGGAGPAPH